MFRRVLVAYDGSEGARRALDVACGLVRRLGGSCHVATAAGEERWIPRAEEVVREGARLAQARGVNVTPHVMRGHPGRELSRLAEEGGFDLAVVGHRGRSTFGGALGGVAAAVARHAACSVLVVRPAADGGRAAGGEVQDMFRRIVVGDDGSDHAHHAFEVALEMAERFGAELHVAAVAQVPDYAASVDEVEESVRQATAYYEEVFARVREAAAHREVRLQTHLLKGHAAQSLIHLADELGADLVVVGSRGLSAFQRYLLGSVSEAVMHHAHCPVLVVKRR